MLWINYKTYPRGTADAALAFSKMCEEVSADTEIPVIICPQVADVYRISQRVNCEVWSQHVDSITPGRNTGKVLPESVLRAGASGVLVNHSENPQSASEVTSIISRCQELGLKSMVFAADLDELSWLNKLDPNYIAFEPPELVGGNVSVTDSDPALLAEAVAKVNLCDLVVGAGVADKSDVAKSLELGAVGVVVSSALMDKSDDPRSLLYVLLEPFQERSPERNDEIKPPLPEE